MLLGRPPRGGQMYRASGNHLPEPGDAWADCGAITTDNDLMDAATHAAYLES